MASPKQKGCYELSNRPRAKITINLAISNKRLQPSPSLKALFMELLPNHESTSKVLAKNLIGLIPREKRFPRQEKLCLCVGVEQNAITYIVEHGLL